MTHSGQCLGSRRPVELPHYDAMNFLARRCAYNFFIEQDRATREFRDHEISIEGGI
jgi:hypothetical protein